MHRTPLTREQLLPIAPSKARTLSLKSHLALAALRQGQGNEDLASELLKTLYLTFFANEAEKQNVLFETFLAAELALKACIHHAVTANEWRIDASHCEVIEALLRVYDAQLASLPVTRSKRRTYG
ncbi:Fis family transcriptional regulator [Caballeronia humi]|uniref:Fis family transcriptional regulator n=2 Tax=Caballeronia humi TaxID=326474 RepID=A0A158JBD8_9BURK|nr:Fis family transcriptional regulator [Caballeronia humi]